MGNLGIAELLLMGPGCILGLFGIVGTILGVIAYFKVRKLEKLVQELRNKPPTDPTA